VSLYRVTPGKISAIGITHISHEHFVKLPFFDGLVKS